MPLKRLDEKRKDRPCYCGKMEKEIKHDIERGGVPDEALVRKCCWKTVCEVRGRWCDPEAIAEVLKEITRKRGYLLARQNPRGF
jgi:hypothetical protein